MTVRDADMALEAQVDLIKSWRSQQGRQFAQGFQTSLMTKGQAYVGFWHGEGLDAWQSDHLDRTETYWISAEMQDVVDSAALSMPAEELLMTDLPTLTGFVLFERSSHMLDVRSKMVGFKAMSWWPARIAAEHYGANPAFGEWIEGFEVSFYSDPMDPKDEDLAMMSMETRKRMPSMLLLHTGFWPIGWSSDQLSANGTKAAEPMYPERTEEEVAQAGASMDNCLRWLKTFWRLIQQRIALPQIVQPNRAVGKRAVRAGLLLSPEVKYITIRKYRDKPDEAEHEPGEGEPVMWTHRWLVDGHWRNQWYAKDQVHRQIWIAPFVKGPEDRPLLIKDKVFRWVR